MEKAINNIDPYQLDLFEPDKNPDERDFMSNLNKDAYRESNLDEDNTGNIKKTVLEKLFNYSLGTNNNSFILTYIDYECPQAFIADETINNALKNRLN